MNGKRKMEAIQKLSRSFQDLIALAATWPGQFVDDDWEQVVECALDDAKANFLHQSDLALKVSYLN